MASQLLRTSCLRHALRSPIITRQASSTTSTINRSRTFTTSFRRVQETPVAPTAGAVPVVKKPVGAFRGGLTGFLLGAVLAGGSMYYYVLDEYRVSNELLTEDIFNLRTTVSRIEGYIGTLEAKIAEAEKRK